MVHFRSRGIGLEQCIQLMKNSRNGTIWFHGEREKNTKLFFYHYLVHGEELQLGPFQGTVACMHIGRGRGVCGTAWAENRTLIVDDVEAFPGHIACSSLSRSEIVVPLHQSNGSVWGVIDIDSKMLSAFDSIDAYYLEKLENILRKRLEE